MCGINLPAFVAEGFATTALRLKFIPDRNPR